MDAPHALLISTIASVWLGAISFLAGLVLYPTFRRIPEEGWREFHAGHAARMTWLVGPAVGLQSLAAVELAARPPEAVPWIGPAVLVGWLFSVGWTGMVSVPCHQRLAGGKDDAAIGRLIRTNHMRSVAWLATGLASAAALASA